MKKTIFIIFFLLILHSCSSEKSHNNPTIYVTITPLKALIEEITCGDFDIDVVVPEGASPESFEPTARHISAMSDAELVFEVGLINFEQSLVKHLGDNLVNLSEGIEPMAGSCSHGHHHSHHHSHGIDPHIWTAPRTLRTMVENAREAIMAQYPDSAKYESAAQALLERIDGIDRRCTKRIKASDAHTMMIYHPAYTYFARDYSIEQIAIEQEGKEPTPRQLTALVERAKSEGINAIFIQPQYSIDKVRAIAEACDAEVIITDPLSKDILTEIERITDIICSYEPRDTH